MTINQSTLLAAAAFFALNISAFAQTAPTTAPAPSTAPTATAKADIPDDSPKGAMLAVVKAMLAKDEKAIIGAMNFSKDEDRPIAVTLFANMVARQKFDEQLVSTFNDEPAPKPDELLAKATDAIGSATVKLDGDSAEILAAKMGGPSWFAIKKDGHWRVDFEKTQDAMDGMPTAKQLSDAVVQTKVLNEMIPEVAAHKFKTPDEALLEKDRRIEAGGKATTAPATAPATTKP